jgi:hypothetical protein
MLNLKGQIISENSLTDDWMYVIKAGQASVYIKFKLIFEEYVAAKTKKYMDVFDKILDLCNVDDSLAYLSEERHIKEKYHTRFQKF